MTTIKDIISRTEQANVNCKTCGKKHKSISGSRDNCASCRPKGLRLEVCPKCGEDTIVKSNRFRTCNDYCKPIDGVEGYDYITCPVTGQTKLEISTWYVKSIGFKDLKEYKEKFGFEKVKCGKLIDDLATRNPFTGHGGKLSPFSKKNESITEEERVANIKKIHDTMMKNDNYTSKLEYWIKKTNGDVEKAKLLLSERQTTFSLKKCVSKYGATLGKKIWKERQTKWLKTLDALPDDVKEEINRKKSTAINKNFKDGTIDDVDGRLYFVKLYSDRITFWKVGITSKELSTRFKPSYLKKNELKMDVLFDAVVGNYYEAHAIEQEIFEDFADHRMSVRWFDFHSTECFHEEIMNADEFEQYVLNYLNQS